MLENLGSLKVGLDMYGFAIVILEILGMAPVTFGGLAVVLETLGAVHVGMVPVLETAALIVVLATLGMAVKVTLERHQPVTARLETTVSATVVLEIHGPVKVVPDTLGHVKEALETSGTQGVVIWTLGSVQVALETLGSANAVLEILVAATEAFDNILTVIMER